MKRFRRLLERYSLFGWVQWGAILLGFVLIARDLGFVALALVVAGSVVLQLTLHRPEQVRDWVFVIAVLAFFAGVHVVGDAAATREFYAITAQVVPALFIALAVQIQVFVRATEPGEERRAAAVTALALVLAEYECLDVVGHGDAGRGDFGVVTGALAAAAVGLTSPVLLGSGPDPAE
jgi:hypothetical protein